MSTSPDHHRIAVPCPLCGQEERTFWGSENGYDMVRCTPCRFLYCSPQPVGESRRRGVELGQHHGDETLDVNHRRNPLKIFSYGRVLRAPEFYRSRFASTEPIRWLDVGCGYGEVIEAIRRQVPPDSIVVGVEPNLAKAKSAQEAGLDVRHTFDLDQIEGGWDVISLINVFSHLTDPVSLIADLKSHLAPGGEIFLETGNVAEIEASEFPDPLYLPDHLCFAGENHIRELFEATGFVVDGVRRARRDSAVWAVWAVVRRLRGRPSRLFMPYRSPFRTMYIRARLAKV